MWLPSALYERIPYYWMLIGLLLTAVSVYLGLEVNRAYMYIGGAVGLASFIWGFVVYARRAGRRETVKTIGNAASGD